MTARRLWNGRVERCIRNLHLRVSVRIVKFLERVVVSLFVACSHLLVIIRQLLAIIVEANGLEKFIFNDWVA